MSLLRRARAVSGSEANPQKARRKPAITKIAIVPCVFLVSAGSLNPSTSVAVAGAEATGSAAVVAVGSVNQNGIQAHGARVMLRVWPSTKTLSALPAGGSIDVPVLHVGTVDADGAFQLPVDPRTISSHYQEPDGTVSFELSVTDGSKEARRVFSAVSGADGLWFAATADGLRDQKIEMGFDFGKSPSFKDRTGSVALALDNKSPLWDDWGPDAPCLPVRAGTWHYGRPEYFARVFGSADAPATITQTYNVDHELGVGMKDFGGHWTMGGTTKISLGASATSPATATSRMAYNKINYRDFYNNCYVYERRPQSVHSLMSDFPITSRPEWNNCTYYAGGTYSKTSGKNVTYSQGMNLGQVFVSAQSGWYSETKLTWTVLRPEYLCGNSPLGWVGSSEAQAG